jgi:hypothetical protein
MRQRGRAHARRTFIGRAGGARQPALPLVQAVVRTRPQYQSVVCSLPHRIPLPPLLHQPPLRRLAQPSHHTNGAQARTRAAGGGGDGDGDGVVPRHLPSQLSGCVARGAGACAHTLTTGQRQGPPRYTSCWRCAASLMCVAAAATGVHVGWQLTLWWWWGGGGVGWGGGGFSPCSCAGPCRMYGPRPSAQTGNDLGAARASTHCCPCARLRPP